ncbi:hypothetical protein Dimus_030220, partial [Dionaea muscipula]
PHATIQQRAAAGRSSTQEQRATVCSFSSSSEQLHQASLFEHPSLTANSIMRPGNPHAARLLAWPASHRQPCGLSLNHVAMEDLHTGNQARRPKSSHLATQTSTMHGVSPTDKWAQAHIQIQ